MAAIDDPAGLGIEPAPEAQGLIEHHNPSVSCSRLERSAEDRPEALTRRPRSPRWLDRCARPRRRRRSGEPTHSLPELRVAPHRAAHRRLDALAQAPETDADADHARRV